MNIDDALTLVNERLTYKTGWWIQATRPTDLVSESTRIVVYVEFRTENSSPRRRDPRPEVLAARWFNVDVTGTELDVLAQVLDGLVDAETHEAREFLRIDGEAPFHPHRNGGVRRFDDARPDGVTVHGR